MTGVGFVKLSVTIVGTGIEKEYVTGAGVVVILNNTVGVGIVNVIVTGEGFVTCPEVNVPTQRLLTLLYG